MVHEKPFKLDMPFDEALKRFAQTDGKELPERKKLKQRKKGVGQSPPSEAPDRKRKPERSR